MFPQGKHRAKSNAVEKRVVRAPSRYWRPQRLLRAVDPPQLQGAHSTVDDELGSHDERRLFSGQVKNR
jgi:hypothetical protein